MMTVRNSKDIKIPLLLGETLEGQEVSADLSKTQHLLITGISGCGKSTMIHNLICHI